MFMLFLYACHQPAPETKQESSESIHKEKSTTNSINIPDTTIQDTIEPMIPEIEQCIMDKGLENVHDHLPQVIIELKYSTVDNFLSKDVYGDLTNAYLQPECITKLKHAWKLLQKHKPGHTFIIYDALRPVSVQQIMWDSLDVSHEKKFWYVAPPGRGSIHNYGMAVDLTIADSNGNPLDMGTKFDYFGKLAFPRFTEKFLQEGKLNQLQANNRKLLIGIMHQSGFSVAKTEWWHFNATSLADAKKRFEPIQ
ncbi:MAG: M15 family metallopeptidase [Bacteroidales bacterium]|nr:M15 family metallopeptidase [Bacteroidales bacterium]